MIYIGKNAQAVNAYSSAIFHALHDSVEGWRIQNIIPFSAPSLEAVSSIQVFIGHVAGFGRGPSIFQKTINVINSVLGLIRLGPLLIIQNPFPRMESVACLAVRETPIATSLIPRKIFHRLIGFTPSAGFSHIISITREKYNIAGLLGYRVFRFTTGMVEGGYAIATIKQALEGKCGA